MGEELSPREFRARIIQRNRPAIQLWQLCEEMLECAVPKISDGYSAFSRALNILFLQAFKSHGSLYFLCVRGHGEDAATILRRLLEIVFQARYLCTDEGERELLGQKYLAWFWLQVPDLLKGGLSPAGAAWWKERYDAHKHLLIDSSGKHFKHWYGNSTIRDLAGARRVDLLGLYEKDYRFLCQMAHCSTQGILFESRGIQVEIRNDRLVSEILVRGTQYMIEVARLWNQSFKLIDDKQLFELAEQTIKFDFSNRTVP